MLRFPEIPPGHESPFCEAFELHPFERQPLLLLLATSRHMRHYLSRRLGELGLNVTVDQWMVLLAMTDFPEGAPQKALCRRLDKDKPTMGRILQLMETRGWLTRAESPDDRRERIARLTEAGETMQAQIRAEADRILSELAQGLTRAEQAQLKELLGKVLGRLLVLAEEGKTEEHPHSSTE